MLVLENERYVVDTTYFSILREEHVQHLKDFASKNTELNEFLVKDALEYQKLNLGITYLLFNQQGKIISYLTIANGALRIPDKFDFEFKGRKLREYPKDFPNQFPALLIGKLATDKDEEGKGGAGLLLDYAVKLALDIRTKAGCVYLVADSYPESVEWYCKKGFKTYILDISKRTTIPMYFEL